MQDKILVTQSSMPPYEEYIEAIKPLWDSHWLTNMGQYHRQLEERLKEYLDVKELSLMVNGTLVVKPPRLLLTLDLKLCLLQWILTRLHR